RGVHPPLPGCGSPLLESCSRSSDGRHQRPSLRRRHPRVALQRGGARVGARPDRADGRVRQAAVTLLRRGPTPGPRSRHSRPFASRDFEAARRWRPTKLAASLSKASFAGASLVSTESAASALTLTNGVRSAIASDKYPFERSLTRL